jgi:hypothetical protein
MDTKDIFIFVLVFSALGFSLYRKYVKKNQGEKPFQKSGTSGTGSSFSTVKDDYEPYSKK